MKKKFFVILLPFISLILLSIASHVLFFLSDKVHYLCPYLFITGYLCPGCGGTRAVRSLYKLNILQSLRYNPSVVTVLLFCIWCYIQLFLNTFIRKPDKQKKEVPTSKVFYILWGGTLMGYYIFRNL